MLLLICFFQNTLSCYLQKCLLTKQDPQNFPLCNIFLSISMTPQVKYHIYQLLLDTMTGAADRKLGIKYHENDWIGLSVRNILNACSN